MAGSALVLGGGGITGVAWELGILAGLAQVGLDVIEADLVIGTSAGSVVGAQITTGTPIEELYARQLRGAGGEIAAQMGRAALGRLAWAMLTSRDPRRFRARVGRLALAANTVSEAERRKVIEARLPVHAWPERRLLITAVDATSGELEVFDRDSGVSLVDAVGASCAVPGVWPPVTIKGRRWIDGGVRSSTNADLAKGADGVLVLAPSPFDGMGPMPKLTSQVAALREHARVVVISPDQAAREAIGKNVLDPARRAPAARAGRAQAAAVADSVEAELSA